jgi:hypothetical protein
MKTNQFSKKLKPISLYPLSPEDALKAVLNTAPPDKKSKSKRNHKSKKTNEKTQKSNK